MPKGKSDGHGPEEEGQPKRQRSGFSVCVQNGGRVRRIWGPNKKYGVQKDQFKDICFLDGKSFQEGGSSESGGD